MRRLPSEVKEMINEFYLNEIKNVNKQIEDVKDLIRSELYEQFMNDEDVIKVKKLLDIINERYNEDYSLIYHKYSIKYEDNEEYKKLQKLKNNIIEEKNLLIYNLICQPISSKEYKKAHENLMNLMKGKK